MCRYKQMKLTRTWTYVYPTFRGQGNEEKRAMKLEMNIQEEIQGGMKIECEKIHQGRKNYGKYGWSIK